MLASSPISGKILKHLRTSDAALHLWWQLDVMYTEERRLQDIKDTLIATVHRNVTLKKGAVLAFMTAQFGTLGKAPQKASICIQSVLILPASLLFS